MWELDNQTDWPAERCWTRDSKGVHHWLVAVKATFDLTGKGLRASEVQDSPRLVPEYFGESGRSSLRYDVDLGLVKPSTDVIVNALAHAPGGRAATEVPVSLRYGSIQKDLLVLGERRFRQGLGEVKPDRSAPFLTQPIRYEWAFGGADLSHPDPAKHAQDGRNPIGRGFALRSSNLVGTPAPCIQSLHGSPASPCGLGPIPSYWSPRREYAGSYDDAWERTQKPLLPKDYNPRHSLCSPADQQSGKYLVGGEVIQLVHMTPSGVLKVELPKIAFQFTTSFGKKREEHPGHLANVIIEPEEMRLMMVWQTSLPVPAPQTERLDSTQICQQGSC